MTIAAIVVAAGRGTRMTTPTAKALLPLSGQPMVVYALRTLSCLRDLATIVLVVAEDQMPPVGQILAQYGPWPVTIQLVCGGAERQDSVAAGLAAVDPQIELVIVHDAARPFVSLKTMQACVDAATATGAAIVAEPVRDTVKAVGKHGEITQTLDRRHLWLAQTPQAFRATLLREAYAQAQRDAYTATDDAALVERLGCTVHVVPGEAANRKITTPDDLHWAEWHLRYQREAGKGTPV